MEAMSGESPGAVSLPLQFRSASPGLEIWPGSQNTGPPGWVDQAGADVKGNLLIEGVLCGVEQSEIRALRNGSVGQFSYSSTPSGGLATIDDGSTSKVAPPAGKAFHLADLAPDRTVE
jgi:hypothetical protein